MQHLEVQEAQSAVFMRDVLENPDVSIVKTARDRY